MSDQASGRAPTIAPRWHTAALIGLIFSVAAVGTLLAHGRATPSSAASGPRIPLYLSMVVVPWMLTVYVARVGRARLALSSLLFPEAEPRFEGRRLAIDLAVAACIVLAVRLCERALAPPVDPAHAAAVASVLPRGPVEHAVWIFVAISVGFGEEVVYRGYLQQQLAAFTGRVFIGVIAQAIVFGVAHANQGLAAAARIVSYGLLFGAVVRWRGSLVPVIVAHVVIDAASGWG
jgi:membrane protease YdiL (CAAX protease family)